MNDPKMKTKPKSYGTMSNFDRRLRRLLMRSKKFDINQLDDFDKELRDSEDTLSSLVVKRGIMSDEELMSLVAMEADIPPFNLDNVTIDENLASKLSKKIAKEYNVCPISAISNLVTIAVCDPFDLKTLENLELAIECQTKRVLATEEAIREAIKSKYPDDPEDEEVGGAFQERAGSIAGSDFDDIINAAQEDMGGGDDEDTIDEVDGAIIRLANKIIVDAYNEGVSDIHIEPYLGKFHTVIRFRVDGQCREYERVPNQIKKALVTRLKIMSGLDIAERRLPQDGKIKFKKYGGLDIELRVATVPTINGNEDAVMRILASSKPMPLVQMGFSERNLSELQRTVEIPYGLILVVGPTGSGKTTTLHSCMGYINTVERKIWTAEDPVEITQRGLRQVQVLPKIGFTFAKAMRAFLRADPDVIMVGEMRDKETASMGIEASLTGHLVLSTLHTNSAPETIVRLIDMGLDPFNFADALLGVMAQRLTRRLCKCKREEILSKEEYDEIVEEYEGTTFEQYGPPFEEGMKIYRSVGCKSCNKGYRGRMGIHEYLVNTDEVRTLIQASAKVSEIKRVACEEGMTTLKQDGILKVFQGHTDLTAIRAVCI